MKKYPKILYVLRDNAGTDDEWFHAETNPADIDEDGVFGVYELKKTVEKTTEAHLK